jgi:hypothetical protein
MSEISDRRKGHILTISKYPLYEGANKIEANVGHYLRDVTPDLTQPKIPRIISLKERISLFY